MVLVRSLIAALGCLLWLLPLVGAIDRVRRLGAFESATPLVAIPIAMIALTVGVGLAPPTHRAFGAALAGVTIVALVAGFFWLAIWGASV